MSGEMGRSRLPVAVVVAVAAAAAATFLLRPRGVIEPVPVEAQQYFTASQLDRAEDFRSVQRLLGLAGLGIGIGTLALLAWRQPWRLMTRLERRPLLGGAAAGAGISLVLVVTGLPVNAWMRARSLDVGLATQSWPDWALDVVKAAGIGAVTAAIGGLIAMALVRRFPRRWWAPAALLVLVYGVVTIWLYPIVIDPVFNRFDKLPQGKLRSEVLQLADQAGVDVGQVYRVDASRRTSAANAYVIGLGHSKRVVLYDNLIDDFSPGEVRTVVAHELGHQKHDDLLRGLAWLAIVAPAGTFLVQALAERAGPRATARHARRAARDRALHRRGQPRPRLRVERAVAQGGGERGLVRAPADARPGGLHRLPAAHLGPERGRPRPAGLVPGAVRDASDDDPADRCRRRVRVQVGCRRPCRVVTS